MTCPYCQAETQSSARFCRHCGASLIGLCPECGAVNVADARFCIGCGRRFARPAPPRLRPVDAGAGPRAYKRVLEGERKLVTVLFADLSASLELVVGDPEEAREVLDPVLERLIVAVHRYEGTVNQVMGDGIMALFGAPIAHEDHAARACYAALAMQTSIREYAREAEPRLGRSIRIRVGLNSGEVVVRAIGNDLHMDYSAIGETTHLASRMEMTAPPGSIRMTAATLRLAEPFVQARSLGALLVKGRKQPVEVFELEGARAIRRMEAAALRRRTHFVGRECELKVLRQALDTALGGAGNVIAVVGEPGIGKSRLLLEFTQSPQVAACLVLEAGTVSYGRTTAYLPVRDMLRRYFGIKEGDGSAAVRERISVTMLTLDPGLGDLVPPLLALFDALPEESPFRTYDPLRRRELTDEAFTRFLVRLAQAQPLVLIVEDLQWVDPETHGVLELLVQRVSTERLLLLVNYRTEYRHDWSRTGRYAELALAPLSRASVDALLGALLGDAPELRPLKDLLIERADGNPFFVEESVRALVDSGSLAGEPGRYEPTGLVRFHVPATVHALLAARIDRLPPEEKRLLQCAAVIGRDVPLSLLETSAEVPSVAIEPALKELQRGEFLFKRESPRGLVYSFKHSLTQEVAYGGLLHDQAKALHAAIVAAMEVLHPESLRDHVQALAHHAVLGEVWPKAVDYLRWAGTDAFVRGSVTESLARYEHALALADRLEPGPDNTARRIDVRLDLHAPLIVLGQVTRLIALHAESEGLARALDDPRRLARLLHRMSQYAWMDGRFSDGLERGEQALGIARKLDDGEIRILASYALALNHAALGSYRPAIEMFRGIVDGPDNSLARRLLAVTVPAYVGAAGWAGYSYALIGELERGLFYTDRAAQAADESDHPQAQAVAYTLRVITLLYRGHIETAVALGERALRLCETKGLLVWMPGASATLGWALALAGRADEAMAQLERGATTMEAIGLRSNLSRVYVWWAEALLSGGRRSDARRVAERALDLAGSLGERGHEADGLRTLGDVLAGGDHADTRIAASYYDRALASGEKLGMLPLVGRCHLGLGRLFAARGDRGGARVHLTRAVSVLSDVGAQFWLAEAEGAMP